MALLAKYRRDTGAIVGVWEGTTLTLLGSQVPADDPDYGGLVVEDERLTAAAVQARWSVVDETLTAKTVLTLTATPNPFAADGTAVCAITITPFVPCTVLLDGVPYALDAGDVTLELRSDVPERFQVTLAALPTHWAEPLTVEAT